MSQFVRDAQAMEQMIRFGPPETLPTSKDIDDLRALRGHDDVESTIAYLTRLLDARRAREGFA